MPREPGARRWRRRLLWSTPLLLLVGVWWLGYGRGELHPVGEIVGPGLAPEVVARRDRRQQSVAAAPAELILFGDLHVHTTFSADAYMLSVPLMAGEGLHPPADACDFARYCSDLDFFALTDHAEALTPRMWRESIASMRACAARSGADGIADLIPFMGFEWSQIGDRPETHYGHKNVVFPSLDPDRLPARPIGAGGGQRTALTGAGVDLPGRLRRATLPVLELPESKRYADLLAYLREVAAVDLCPEGVPSPALSPDCRELAATPAELFAKLDAWRLDALVIPHGTAWGLYTPPGYAWDKQLDPVMDDPQRQRLVEIHSGHGNVEPYRPWRHVIDNGDGTFDCPAPSEGFEPCCWRAGELMAARCAEAGESAEVCDQKAQAARLDHANSGIAGHLALPGTTTEEWGQCGQCTDCVLPSFELRPRGTAQYMLSRGHFAPGRAPRHATLGFIASSDNHSARPGTGYKEFARRKMTEAKGPRGEFWRGWAFGEPGERTVTSERWAWVDAQGLNAFTVLDMERQASFFTTGGLVAVHAPARTREAVYRALVDRRVYATSGPRILLWFDVLNAPGGPAAMGQQVAMDAAPRFRVRAAGAFVQRPGCPTHVAAALGPDRLERLCVGECYHPGERRHPITRLEVVRIRRQQSPDEAIGDLIDDPWRTLPCPPGAEVCEASFTGEPPDGEREVLYYVRAIQAPTPAVNGGGLRCEGERCRPCYGDWRVDFTDDCLAPVEERAWSSPIYLRAASR